MVAQFLMVAQLLKFRDVTFSYFKSFKATRFHISKDLNRHPMAG